MLENNLKTTNDTFIDCLNDDIELAKKATLSYVIDRLKEFGIDVIDVEIQIGRIGHIIELSVRGKLNGRDLSGSQEWTDMELLSFGCPITSLIEQVLRRVFEVPLEGASVS